LQKIRVFYKTFDTTGIEQIRLQKKPSGVILNQSPLKELQELSSEGYLWKPLKKGGLLSIQRMNGNKIAVVE
jgi:hypothetical protein